MDNKQQWIIKLFIIFFTIIIFLDPFDILIHFQFQENDKLDFFDKHIQLFDGQFLCDP